MLGLALASLMMAQAPFTPDPVILKPDVRWGYFPEVPWKVYCFRTAVPGVKPEPKALHLYGGYDTMAKQWRYYHPVKKSWGEPKVYGANPLPNTHNYYHLKEVDFVLLPDPAPDAPTPFPLPPDFWPFDDKMPLLPDADKKQNFGIDEDEMDDGGFFDNREVYILNGKQITKEQAERQLAGVDLPDDGDCLRLTVIGSEKDRQRIATDWVSNPAFAEFQKSVLFQSYPPDHWAVKDVGFKVNGECVIYCQKPDGTVVHRQDDYKDGPEGLATALRRAVDYDPLKDKDLRKTPLGGGSDSPLMPLAIVLGALGGGALLLQGVKV